jgi:hypothetical protein
MFLEFWANILYRQTHGSIYLWLSQGFLWFTTRKTASEATNCVCLYPQHFCHDINADPLVITFSRILTFWYSVSLEDRLAIEFLEKKVALARSRSVQPFGHLRPKCTILAKSD